jgi:cell division protein FtsB
MAEQVKKRKSAKEAKLEKVQADISKLETEIKAMKESTTMKVKELELMKPFLEIYK